MHRGDQERVRKAFPGFEVTPIEKRGFPQGEVTVTLETDRIITIIEVLKTHSVKVIALDKSDCKDLASRGMTILGEGEERKKVLLPNSNI